MSDRILLLEDDQYIQDLIAMKCKLEGVDLTVATSIKSAIEYLDEGGWALIVIDIMFPTATGVDIAEYILEKEMALPFIFISAKNKAIFTEEFAEAITKYPAISKAEYIMKPFDLDFLIKKIRETITNFKTE